MRRLVLSLIASTAGVGAAMAADLPAAPVEAAPVYAAPLFDAYFGIGLGYGWNRLEQSGAGVGSANNNGFALQGRATFEVPISNRFGAQMDGVLGRDWNSFKAAGVTTDDPTTTATLAGHLFWRDPNVGLVGAIGQYTNQSTDFNTGFAALSISNDHYYAGVEGQYFFNAFTLYGQAAYRHSTLGFAVFGGSSDGNGVALAGQLRYFVTPDWLVAAKGGFDRVEYSFSLVGAGGLTQTAWTAGLHSEYRLASVPVSVFGDLSYAHKHSDGSAVPFTLTEQDTRAMVGLKYSFGTRTLLERDRAGASLDPFESHFSYPFF